MNFTMFSLFALVALATDSTAQFNFASFIGPPAVASNGWLLGQEASKNAANLAVNSAIAKANSTDLPPELEEELQLALAEADLGLAACDDLLITSSVWRYKICKFQEIGKLKLKIQELKLKAAALATATTVPPTSAANSFQSDANSQSAA